MRRGTRITGLSRIIVLGALGAFIGTGVAAIWNPAPFHPVTYLPDAYRVPKIPGGTALRMAMVHDVLHERYLRHGNAWYQQRNQNAQKILDAEAMTARPTTQPSEKYLDAMDDLAVGDERLGKFDDGIALMRKKLQLLSPLPPTAAPATQPENPEADDLQKILAAKNLTPVQHQQYTACANLGTILLIKSMGKAITGDRAAQGEMRESLDWVERAIAINPGGHFGRERWQAILIEDLLAAIEHPEMLGAHDAFGNGKDFKSESRGGSSSKLQYLFWNTVLPPDDQLWVDQRLSIRRRITRLDPANEWCELVKPDYREGMPFDEPLLAMIGMWTMGGGPTPHFSQSIGLIMELVYQRQIAWNAYERTVELQDSFWPDPGVRKQLIEFCRDRQNIIAQDESPNDPDAWQHKMRDQHQQELAWGIAYQNAYQDFEATQIAAGMALDNPNFYTAFFKDRPPIASDPGQSDELIIRHTQARNVLDVLPLLVFGIGVGTFLGLIIPERHLS